MNTSKQLKTKGKRKQGRSASRRNCPSSMLSLIRKSISERLQVLIPRCNLFPSNYSRCPGTTHKMFATRSSKHIEIALRSAWSAWFLLFSCFWFVILRMLANIFPNRTNNSSSYGRKFAAKFWLRCCQAAARFAPSTGLSAKEETFWKSFNETISRPPKD